MPTFLKFPENIFESSVEESQILLETGRQNARVCLRVPLIKTTQLISFGEQETCSVELRFHADGENHLPSSSYVGGKQICLNQL